MNQTNRMASSIDNSDLNDTTGRESIFARIREGMGVYDVRDNHIGHVAFVHFGAASETQQELGTGPTTITRADDPNMRHDTIIDNIAEAFAPDEVPGELQEKLLLNGYIRLDTAGLFASDRFIVPEQIAGVSDDKVMLSVSKDQLVKRS